jgi:hypothetical protein
VAGTYGGRAVAAKKWRESGDGRYMQENVYHEMAGGRYHPDNICERGTLLTLNANHANH